MSIFDSIVESVFGKTRKLKPAEEALAKTVFQKTVPYQKVRIANNLGLGGAAWTEYFNGIYTLHMGDSAYADCTSRKWVTGVGVVANTFIHEMTHVWQGSHSSMHAMYEVKSLFSQAQALLRTGNRGSAYQYTAGTPWNKLNVEQQASAVEDWFADGLLETSPLYPYIRDTIRK
jgi:hypothetical protein